MITPIEYEEIPEIIFEGRSIKEYIATVKPIDNTKQKYYYILTDYNIDFYLETTNPELTVDDAYDIYDNELDFYTSFDTIIELEIETIQCGTYIDDNMRAGWSYFNQLINNTSTPRHRMSL